jgi:hypothetical protein
VRAHDRGGAAQFAQRHEQPLDAHGVLADGERRFAGYLAHGYRQQRVGKADLADLVQQRGDEHFLRRLAVEAHLGGDPARISIIDDRILIVVLKLALSSSCAPTSSSCEAWRGRPPRSRAAPGPRRRCRP